jgi:hypothetical protein
MSIFVRRATFLSHHGGVESQRPVPSAITSGIFGGVVPPLVTLLVGYHHMGLAMAMLAGTVVGAISYCLALLAGPETKGTRFKADLTVA